MCGSGWGRLNVCLVVQAFIFFSVAGSDCHRVLFGLSVIVRREGGEVKGVCVCVWRCWKRWLVL